MKKNIYLFVGTTAEFIKLAPVIKEFKKRKVPFKLITSGQNQILFNDFEPMTGKIEVDHAFLAKPFRFKMHPIFDFIVWSLRSYLLYLVYFNREFKGLDKKNSLIVVHGDTVSAFLGTTVAKLYGLKIAHIESGLRSFNFFEPFPEELCRYFVSMMSDIHFCPNQWAVNNLKNKRGVKINTKNNTLIDSLRQSLIFGKKSDFLKRHNNEKYFLLILHRQEHIFFKKDVTKKFLNIFIKFARSDFKCVLVLHDLTDKFLEKENLKSELKKGIEDNSLVLVPRLPYIEFMQILKKAEFIATDGGSNQEESYYLGKPCLILRNVTERIEGLGENAVLSKGDGEVIRNFIRKYKNYKRKPVKMRTAPSKIIVDYIMR